MHFILPEIPAPYVIVWLILGTAKGKTQARNSQGKHRTQRGGDPATEAKKYFQRYYMNGKLQGDHLSLAADLIVLPMSNEHDATAEYLRIIEIESGLLASSRRVVYYLKQCMVIMFLFASWDTLIQFATRPPSTQRDLKSIQDRVDITQLLVSLPTFRGILAETNREVAELRDLLQLPDATPVDRVHHECVHSEMTCSSPQDSTGCHRNIHNVFVCRSSFRDDRSSHSKVYCPPCAVRHFHSHPEEVLKYAIRFRFGTPSDMDFCLQKATELCGIVGGTQSYFLATHPMYSGDTLLQWANRPSTEIPVCMEMSDPILTLEHVIAHLCRHPKEPFAVQSRRDTWNELPLRTVDTQKSLSSTTLQNWKLKYLPQGESNLRVLVFSPVAGYDAEYKWSQVTNLTFVKQWLGHTPQCVNDGDIISAYHIAKKETKVYLTNLPLSSTSEKVFSHIGLVHVGRIVSLQRFYSQQCSPSYVSQIAGPSIQYLAYMSTTCCYTPVHYDAFGAAFSCHVNMEGSSKVWITKGARDLPPATQEAIGLPAPGAGAFDENGVTGGKVFRQKVYQGNHLLGQDYTGLPQTHSITLYPGMSIWLTAYDGHYFVKHPMQVETYGEYMASFVQTL